LIERPSAIEVLGHTKRTLDSIRNLTELSQAKFSDKAFGQPLYRSVTKDIEEANLLLESFLRYLSVNTPLRKRNTVHKLIEEVLEKYQIQLEERQINLSKTFEKDLPETIVPDEPLRYILDVILQYGVSLVTPNGYMEFLTQSFILQGEGEAGQVALRKNERYIEIKVFVTGSKKLGKQFEERSVFQKGEPLDLLLRLVKEVVRENRGIMKFEIDEKKGMIFISIRFPSERREIAHYQPIHPLMN
jgi:hypothetical protein